MTAITLETIKARQDELAAMIAEFNANKSRTITLTVNGREWVLPEPLRVKPAHDEAEPAGLEYENEEWSVTDLRAAIDAAKEEK